MKKLVIRGLGFVSFLKLSGLLSIHLGLILALVFLLTNNGRTVNLGTYYFFDGQADGFGFILVWVSVTVVTFFAGSLSYVPIGFLIKLFGGLTVTGDVEP